MADILENQIEAAEPNADTYTIRLTWRNGNHTVAEFGHLVGHRVFEPLRDPQFFNCVTIQQNGRVLAWPNAIDFCADALWFQAHPRDIPDDLVPFYGSAKTERHLDF